MRRPEIPLVDCRLDELDKNEFRDVAKLLRPHIPDEEFDEQWIAFMDLKRAKERQ